MRALLSVLFFSVLLATPLAARSHRHHLHRHDYTALIRHAEAKATPSARQVLLTARAMVESRVIIQGACWDYLNAAFTRAGFPPERRTVPYRRGKGGPYVDLDRIRPGDWLYYINHSYGDIEHSGLFIDWIDRPHHIGLILSYAGERRRRPGRYRPYDLSHVYQITRPQPLP